jgi:nucleoside-diphosphate-sugar epimerase
MKILITGASGFIGGFLVEAAIQKNWEVWAGIRKTSDRKFLTQSGLRFIDLNYADVDALQLQVRQHVAEHGAWDYVVHNAGITKCVDETDFHRINHLYTVHLVQALGQSLCKPTKFLFMSSMGAVGPGDAESGAPLTSTHLPNPVSEYGRSKLLAEDYLRTLTDFPWVILRPTGVYGPRDRDYYVLMKLIKKGVNVSVGLQQQMLNFIYVKDLASACILALESPYWHKTWFVADGDYYTSDAYSMLIQDVLHQKKVLTIRIPLILVKLVSMASEGLSQLTGKPALLNADKYQVMKQRNWTCSASELEHDLSFKAAYNLRKGLEETVAWYTENGWL